MLRLVCCLLACLATAQSAPPAKATPKAMAVNAFSFDIPLTLPGTPEEIFDAATGDVSGWWDHTFSPHPKSLILEPKAGGHFIEQFDDQGNGAQHAEVIYCDRPKTIRFTGPLGLSGTAVNLVCTYTFEAVGTDSTRMTLHASAAGAFDEGASDVVERVWQHFLIERFKPYIESGKYKKQ
ncbi:MAG TPA: SRPBCC domain-containing protein [Candidatus Krumholzibacteria bacterium]|nr:SRPBCC domain-containing protein [Candidatus Krumholzibacteria bacterium]